MQRAILLTGEKREFARKQLNVKRYKDFNSEYFFQYDTCRIIGVYDCFLRCIIGCVFFDPIDEEIGIALIPQMQGKHLGNYVLHHGLKWIKRYYPSADVHAQCNVYSYRLFESEGFVTCADGDLYLTEW
jgi:hypothetical protein|tara:strand:+ start:210 stop:596 length:387 start_codon:yes stop_codon:yes gene_type:complete